MEPRLIQTQTQKLILSPQIRQYLQLLQLPLLQLQHAIEQELTENPVLEEVTKDGADEVNPGSSSENGPEEHLTNGEAEELRFDETIRSLDRLDDNLRESLYSQDDLSLPETRALSQQKNYQESLITRRESLSDYLLWQLGFLDLGEEERKITDEIIGNLNDDGYLAISLDDLAKACEVPVSEVETVLQKLQSLDPPGIAARNLQEVLLLQLQRKEDDTELAKKIVQDYLPLLEKKQFDLIARHLQANPEDVREAAKLIAHLDPKPGRTFYGEESIAVTPDATVYFDDEHKLRIDVHDEELPEIRISPYYRRLLKDQKLDPQSRKFVKEKIQAALDFVKALSQRRSTLRGITEEIVQAQPEFFDKGFSQLRPLRLKDISSRLGIHESTVSRAIQEKYISTPQGTLPYKSFFSSKLDRTEGGAESQKSMLEKIRALIKVEDSAHPLSDQALTEILKKEGIKIARRTVAKYRELLRILPSHLRSRK